MELPIPIASIAYYLTIGDIIVRIVDISLPTTVGIHVELVLVVDDVVEIRVFVQDSYRVHYIVNVKMAKKHRGHALVTSNI